MEKVLTSLSKESTSVIKGMAILLMLFHHAYGLYGVSDQAVERALEDEMVLVFHPLAHDAKACVSLFAFVSGYGYYMCALREKSSPLVAGWKRMKKFYPLYVSFCLLVMLLAVMFPCGSSINSQHWASYLAAMFGLSNVIADYWYIGVVILTALLGYPVLLLGKRGGEWCHLLSFFVILAVSNAYGVYRVLSGTRFNGCIEEIPCFYALPWLTYFLLGWGLAHLHLKRVCVGGIMIGSCAILIILRSVVSEQSLSLVFLACTVAVLLLAALCRKCPQWSTSWIVSLGNYSACMWLNHRLLFGYWFADFFYSIPAPVNYFLLVLVSYVCARLVMNVWRKAAGIISHPRGKEQDVALPQ